MEKKNLLSEIEGARIVLKKHQESLAATMFSYVEKDRSRLERFLPWVSATKTVEDEIRYIQRTHIAWDSKILFDYGLFRKNDGLYLGNIGLHSIHWESNRCEVGYWILGKFEGQGYMSEALRILEAHAFDIGFHRIEIRCSSHNQRSANVPLACGYIFDGVLKENSFEQGQYQDIFVFSKLSHQYRISHIDPMTEMDKPLVLDIAKNLPQFFTPKGLELISHDLCSQKGFILRTDDKAVGFIMYFANQGIAEIGWMAVRPEFQNKGIGRELLNHLKDELIKCHSSALFVKTLDDSVDYKPYDQTRAFYLKNGFKKVQVLQHPENPECEAELVLKMDLKF